MGCRDQPVTCRSGIAGRYDLTPNKRKPWQYEGKCPKCHHGGFGLGAPNQVPNAPRHIWHCNCHRCRCHPGDIRTIMLSDGIPEDCLGSYARKRRDAGPPTDPAAVVKAAMRDVLADDKIRALADLKIRMLEAVEGEPAPADWDGFMAFAKRAGVQQSKRYDAAARWGRGRYATAVVPDSGK